MIALTVSPTLFFLAVVVTFVAFALLVGASALVMHLLDRSRGRIRRKPRDTEPGGDTPQKERRYARRQTA